MAGAARLVDTHDGQVIVARLLLATTFWQRLRGLQFRPALGCGEGLLLAPCRSVHTHGLRWALDVAFLSRSGQLLRVAGNVRPWQMVFGPRGTFAVVETAVGGMAHWRVGRSLRVVDDAGQPRLPALFAAE